MIAWPGDPAVTVKPVLSLDKADPAAVSRLDFGSHTGTHVDAFSHFKPHGLSVDQMSLAPYLGPVLVLPLPKEPVITPCALDHLLVDWEVDGVKIERLLIKTDNSQQAWSEAPFDKQFVHLNEDAAQYLVARGLRLVGMDYLSVDGFYAEGVPVHHCLMDAGVYILEGLDLSAVPAGWYELLCLPLKIAGCDGAPARVVLREIID
jgi:arylformamidase